MSAFRPINNQKKVLRNAVTNAQCNALVQKALVFHQDGKLVQARDVYIEVLKKQADHFHALQLLGAVYLASGQSTLAIEVLSKAIKLNPKYAPCYANRGAALRQKNKYADAIADYTKAIDLDPDYAEAYSNRGNMLRQLGELEAALTDFNMALQLKNNFADAYSNRAGTLIELSQFYAALDDCNSALNINPHSFDALFNRGSIFQLIGKYSQALSDYQNAIILKPDYVDAHSNLASLSIEMGDFYSAIVHLNRAFELCPDFKFLRGTRLFTHMKLCDWNDLSLQMQQLQSAAFQGDRVSPPFPLLTIVDDPSLHLLSAKEYVKTKYLRSKLDDIYKPYIKVKKIRIGYYSADFYNHAVAHLIAELFASHDRNRFEIYGFSFRPTNDDAKSTRLITGFDQFIDVSSKSDREVAQLSKELGIDIAVDLMGFTQYSRTGIFAERCAPVQVNYLGYPGTMGAPYIDYIVADHLLIPPESQTFYSEKIVYMPNSYQVNDSKRPISDRIFTRQELYLPEHGFVFCCFNNNYKITPDTFTIWMRLLDSVEGSVLWLIEDNPTAAKNLRMEAQARGIDPTRLVFAGRMALPEHLARHQLADLFLDTLPYNAHTTASDALWAGLPVLTLMGKSFAARVAGSLLTAMDLPELITYTPEEYEAKALDLALHPEKLAAIKEKLIRNRATTSLFNGKLFAKHLEEAYITMHERAKVGLPAEHIVVSPELPAEDINVSPELATEHLIATPNFNQAPIVLNTNSAPLKVFDFLELERPIQVMDIGASVINEVPIYKILLDKDLGHLHAFEGDQRQIAKIRKTYGDKASIFDAFLFDGTKQTLYLASEASGMSSLLKPREAVLQFFNGFTEFGTIFKTEAVQTQRLDDVANLPQIDFVKMDIQGAELTVLKHGLSKLKECVAIQLEVSYVCLYENQPTFGDVDVWLRSCGYVPHCFLDIKRWSIAPTIFNNNFRVPGNQLLESDVVFIKDPLRLDLMTENQIKNLITLAHYCFKSVDLAMFLMLELLKRNAISPDIKKLYLDEINRK